MRGGSSHPRAPPPQAEVVTLARQIIEATPERIKHETPPAGGGTAEGGGAGGGGGGAAAPPGGGLSAAMAWLATYLDSVDRPPAAPPHR